MLIGKMDDLVTRMEEYIKKDVSGPGPSGDFKQPLPLVCVRRSRESPSASASTSDESEASSDSFQGSGHRKRSALRKYATFTFDRNSYNEFSDDIVEIIEGINELKFDPVSIGLLPFMQ